MHRHVGDELMYVIEGSISDEFGTVAQQQFDRLLTQDDSAHMPTSSAAILAASPSLKLHQGDVPSEEGSEFIHFCVTVPASTSDWASEGNEDHLAIFLAVESGPTAEIVSLPCCFTLRTDPQNGSHIVQCRVGTLRLLKTIATEMSDSGVYLFIAEITQ